MCGISGFCDFSLNYYDKKPFWETILVQMHETLKHRGPDQAMIDLQPHVGLSHARLSIRDLKSGIQPMTRTFHGKTCSIVYNGEIYNHRELLPELQAAGYRFTTTSDTEIILCAYMHFGKDFVEKLNGIFAFAIWDDTTRELLLYRDRAGTKPLFYTQTGSSFVFGSEPKALFCHPDVTPSIDKNSLQEILAVGPARTSGNGVFTGVKEVMPGHYHIFCPDGQHDILYWDLPCREHKDSYVQTVQTVSFLVRDTVERQMVSDVPVCTFLSGGIDSSIVTALAARHMQKEGKILNTFSFDFSENEKYFKSNAFQPERDLPYVNRMLQYCKTSHTYLECSQEALFAALSDAVTAKDLPGMTDVDASLLYFCSEVAKHNKVTLTGECADEIFGGYPWYRDPEVRAREGFPWAQNTMDRAAILTPAITLDPAEFVMDVYNQTCRESDILPGTSDQERRMKQMVNLNFRWFMQTLLDRKDRMSMYHSLEVRVPFCDYRIAEYLYGVPWEFKDYQGQEKGLLRRAVEGLLPEPVLHRKKSPYPKTFDPRYEQLMETRLQTILDDPAAPLWQLVSAEEVKKLLHRETQWPWYGQLMRRPQTIAYLCQIDFWLRHYSVELVF